MPVRGRRPDLQTALTPYSLESCQAAFGQTHNGAFVGTLNPPRNLEASEPKAVAPRATLFDRYGDPVSGSTQPKSEETSVEVDELSG